MNTISKTEEEILLVKIYPPLEYSAILDFIGYEKYKEYEEVISMYEKAISMDELNSEDQNFFFQKLNNILPLIDNYQIKERFIVGLVYELIKCKNFITALEVITELKSTDIQTYSENIAEELLKYFSDEQELVTFFS